MVRRGPGLHATSTSGREAVTGSADSTNCSELLGAAPSFTVSLLTLAGSRTGRPGRPLPALNLSGTEWCPGPLEWP